MRYFGVVARWIIIAPSQLHPSDGSAVDRVAYPTGDETSRNIGIVKEINKEKELCSLAM